MADSRFANIASIASQINEKSDSPEVIIIVSGIVVTLDLHAGKVSIPREGSVGGLTEYFSEELHRDFLDRVETALVMKMQIVLLDELEKLGLSDLTDFVRQIKPNLETAEPYMLEDGLAQLVHWAKPAPKIPNLMTLFQPARQSPAKAALYAALSGEDLMQLNSLTKVKDIVNSVNQHFHTPTMSRSL